MARSPRATRTLPRAVLFVVVAIVSPLEVSGFAAARPSRSVFRHSRLETAPRAAPGRGNRHRARAAPAALMSSASGQGQTAEEQAATPTPPPPAVVVQTSRVTLSSGTAAEIMVCVPSPASSSSSSKKPPLVFIHGSFHAAWCWAVHYMPYFASLGYPTAALSLRGTAGTPHPDGEDVVKKVKIEEHVNDVRAFLDYVVTDGDGGLGLGGGGSKPVLIAHSFGGLSAMKLLERGDEEAASEYLSGVALLCSVPPSGISKMSMRSLRRTPLRAVKTIAGLAMKKSATNPALCREMFFDDDMAEGTVLEYMGYFKRDSVATMDLADLSKKLPSAGADEDGRAAFAGASKGTTMPPALVMGGRRDFIVDEEGVQQTAAYFGVEPTMVDAPHDVMLCTEWRKGADALRRFLEKEVDDLARQE